MDTINWYQAFGTVAAFAAVWFGLQLLMAIVFLGYRMLGGVGEIRRNLSLTRAIRDYLSGRLKF